MIVSVTYEARTRHNILARTFDSADLAKQWARDNAHLLPGLSIREVTTTVCERTVWRDRPALRVVA